MAALADMGLLVECIPHISRHNAATFAQRVGKARRKFKVSPPDTTGDPGFVRVFRAQQNCFEFYPVFLAGLWSSSLLCHQTPASILGIVYIIARERYFVGYSEVAEKRLPPFKTSMWCLVGLSVLSCVGIGNLVLSKVTGKSLFTFFR